MHKTATLKFVDFDALYGEVEAARAPAATMKLVRYVARSVRPWGTYGPLDGFAYRGGFAKRDFPAALAEAEGADWLFFTKLPPVNTCPVAIAWPAARFLLPAFFYECERYAALLTEKKTTQEARYSWRPKPYNKAKVPDTLRAAVYSRDGHACLVCGRRDRLSVDHIVPERKGGPMRPENLQTLCKPCNSRKGMRVADYRKAASA